MKTLLLLVLVGCAVAYASDGWDRTLAAQVDVLFGDDSFIRVYRASDPTTEVGKKLQETLDHLLEKVKEAVDHGRKVKEDVIQKLKEVREKMKDLKVDMGDKAKELLKKITDRAKDFLQNLLDQLGLKDSKDAVRRASIFDREEVELIRREDGDDTKTELGRKLKETLDQLLEKVKEAVDHGRTVKEDVVQKLKEVREKLKDLKVDIGDKAKELLKKIQDKAKDFIQNLLDRLGLKDSKYALRRSAIFEREVEELIRRAEDDDAKTELGRKLREALDHIMEKIKETLEQGKSVKQDVIDRLKDIRTKLKELKIDIGDKAKELLEKIKEKAKDYLRDLLDRLGLKDKRSVAHSMGNIRGLFKKVKKALISIIDKEKLVQKIEELFGRGNELADQFVAMIKEKGEIGKKKLLELVDRILDDKEEERRSRSIQDLWDRVKNYFKDLKIDLKEKYLKFGEWVKEKVTKGIDSSKTKLENIKAIAKEFVDKSKDVSKDVAAEALEFLKPYKEDLGNLWDQVKNTVKDVFNRND